MTGVWPLGPVGRIMGCQRLGWAGLKNGALFQRATGEYDVLITGDRNLEYQQNGIATA